MKKLIIAVAVVICLSGLVSAAPIDKNIVENPGFENICEDGTVTNWSAPQKRFSYVRNEGRDGSCALKFSIDKEMLKRSKYGCPKQEIKVEPGKRYRFSAWVRTEKLVGKGNGAALYIECRDAMSNYVWGVKSLDVVGGTVKKWKQISVPIDIPTNTVTCSFSPFVAPTRRGTAWFDDIECVLEDKPIIIGGLVSNIYRDTAVGGEVVFSAGFSVGNEEISRRGLKILFDIPQATGGVYTCNAVVQPAIENGFAQVKTDVLALPVGKSQVGLRLVDGDGKLVESRKLKFRRVEKMPDWKVRIDANNRILMDGKPFFPVGIYLRRFTEQAFLDVSNSPFNCVMCYHRPSREELDRFHAAGKKVIYSIKGAYIGLASCPKEIVDKKTEREWVEKHIREIKDHPAVMAWYICDELTPVWIDCLKTRYELVRQIDSNHPIFMVLNRYNHLREYAGTYDVVGTDPYPICNRVKLPISWTEESTRRICSAAMGKALWQVPQIFDWGRFRKHPTRAPTEAEIKNMAWQCVAAGANGILPYSYGALREMDHRDSFDRRWAEVCRVYGEIVKYAPLFLSVEKAPKVSGMPQRVFARAFRHEGKNWLLAVNTLNEQSDCCISVDDCSDVKMTLPPLGVDMRQLSE